MCADKHNLLLNFISAGLKVDALAYTAAPQLISSFVRQILVAFHHHPVSNHVYPIIIPVLNHSLN